MKKKYTISLLSYFLYGSPLIFAQAPINTSLSPARNSNTALSGTSIAFTFNQPMNSGGTTLGAFRVFSKLSGGRRTGTGSVNGNTLSFQPITNFKSGETIFTTLLQQAQNSTGTALTRGLVYQFTTRVTGTGRGNLGTGSTTSVESNPQDIRTGDLDNDGKLDVVAVNYASNSVSIRLGTGTGSFTVPSVGAQLSTPGSPLGVELGDIDNDGDLDLLVAGSTTVYVYRNNGGEVNFSAPTSINFTDNVSALTLGDVDSDGDLDFVVANSNASGTGSTASLRLNDGNGQFTTPVSGSTISLGNGPVWVALHDMDGDADLDLLASNVFGNSLSIRLNNGNGFFSAPASNAEVTVGVNPSVFSVGDVDNDGDLDVAVGNGGSKVASILANDGSGRLSTLSSVLLGNLAQSVCLGDIDSDGDLDLVAVNSLDNTVSVRLNNGSGTFEAPAINPNPLVGNFPVVVLLADLDNDNDLDILTNDFNGNSVTTLLNKSLPPTVSGFTAASTSVCSGNAVSFSATVGNVTGSYAYTLTNGSNPISGTSNVTTLNLSLTAVGSGSQSFTLTINSDGQLATASTPLTVNASPTASILKPASSTLTCTTTSLSLTATGGGTYLWDNSTTNAVRTLTTAGTYSVKVTGANSCTAAATTTITSNTLLALSTGVNLPQANVGVVVSLTASGATTYQWTAPPTVLLTSPTTASALSVSLTTAGEQSFTLVGTSGVCSQSALVSVTALAGPDLSAILLLPSAGFSAGETKGMLMQLQEVNGATASGAVVITITVPTGYSVSFDNTLTSLQVSGGSVVSVSNSRWELSGGVGSQQLRLALKGGESIGARSTVNVGIWVSRTSANGGSSSNITVNVADDSSGSYDVNRLNNVYARIITGQ